MNAVNNLKVKYNHVVTSQPNKKIITCILESVELHINQLLPLYVLLQSHICVSCHHICHIYDISHSQAFQTNWKRAPLLPSYLT